ncbi:hypothetical protein A2870_01255 [Candidatus Curtissbacteria bacterium RIFCSPHIGHO2_01_FULL_41_11]|uniref:ECF transporter S component n=1 Tax=Candidatus Curtissbacteria bacterium RIFCSPHIGHO2_01_FULL_41_11 TaxID=1797711 RepID=A0A1F5G7K9_9BACT|nr:MAG: hypothetical protein A2870_01255 [Candidatus Curtissbacteria bacterium RIFCSPHIGHO2_01_FULL_41_11]
MKSKWLFVLFFVVLGFVALQIPINYLEGSRVKFTLFDLFAPVFGALLGTGIGIISVFVILAVNLVTHGFSGINTASPLTLAATLRFLPFIVGVYFFAKKEGKLLVIPALAIIAFNLHPVGRSVWFYSLFWVIPFLVWPFRERFLLARALGTTMTAHAVGGAVWIWAFPTTALFWTALIPIVILERSIFTLGISSSYILMNNVLAFLSSKKLLPRGILVSKKYLLRV